MKDFTFRAPTLFDASATATAEEEDILHDAPGAADHLAKLRKFAHWLKSEMVNKGLAASGPDLDEGSWMISVPSKDGFTLCLISGSVGDDPRFTLLVTEIGDAPADVGDAVEGILRHAREISELTVE